ncbi:MAG: hypothetical protein JNN07_10200 [Verrucomicrobiales bacterium]|nr:hypothetical protein [Verrucomicrobiales bacterium]
MNISCIITGKFKTLAVLALSFVVAGVATTSMQAESFGRFSNPLLIKGYNTYNNVGFVDPANPTILQVRTDGQGGVSHLGKMRSWSTDQQSDLTTGQITANYTFEDENGDQLVMFGTGPSALQPDGRITFDGTFTVTCGTGKFRRASGTLSYEGWARTTDFVTGVGIGFLTIDGMLYGTKIHRDTPFAVADQGIGTIFNDGQDFTYAGAGFATGVGRFDSAASSTPGPFRAAFVGFVDGRMVLSSSFETVWTVRGGDQIRLSGVEFISFAVVTLPDGTQVPDFSQTSIPELYYTVEGGTGRFRNAQGVYFAKGTFAPKSPDTVDARWKGLGFFSRNCGER